MLVFMYICTIKTRTPKGFIAVVWKYKVTKNKSYLSHFADVEPNDYKRLMSDDEYLSRFFLHCTDIPGDNLKNTEEMIIRSLRFRKENGVRGNFSRV